MVRERVIEIINLTKIYQGMGKRVVALDNLNFKVYEGEIVGVIGPNGAGKTTLCLIISGLLSPTSGKVYVFNDDVSKLRWRICKEYIASHFAHVAEIGRSFLRFTVLDYLILNSAINAILGDLRKKAEQCLKAVNLWEFKNERINRLSSGMLRRVMLAELLMWDKPIMILDRYI
ncbi:MAG TPA: ABC transporter ATP-binding protein [Candidatus Bathyarchaeota archaeon]|nr:ABC transporter ATP-binding protein [Candidatus Bathyarchaeota archaeon]